MSVVLEGICVLESSCDSRVSAGKLGKIFTRNEKIKPERHSGETQFLTSSLVPQLHCEWGTL